MGAKSGRKMYAATVVCYCFEIQQKIENEYKIKLMTTIVKTIYRVFVIECKKLNLIRLFGTGMMMMMMTSKH